VVLAVLDDLFQDFSSDVGEWDGLFAISDVFEHVLGRAVRTGTRQTLRRMERSAVFLSTLNFWSSLELRVMGLASFFAAAAAAPYECMDKRGGRDTCVIVCVCVCR
jgi:hypothetical protein